MLSPFASLSPFGRRFVAAGGGGGHPLSGFTFLAVLQTHDGDGVPVGLYTDTGCTTPATADGDLIAAWKDELYGTGIIFTQPTSAYRPVLRFSGGVPVVSYETAGSTYLECSTLSSSATKLFGMVGASIQITSNSYGRILSVSNVVGNIDYASALYSDIIGRYQTDPLYFSVRNSGSTPTVSMPYDTWTRIGSYYDATNVRMIVDGTFFSPVGSTGNFGWSYARIGAHTVGGDGIAGQITSAIIGEGTYADADIQGGFDAFVDSLNP